MAVKYYFALQNYFCRIYLVRPALKPADIATVLNVIAVIIPTQVYLIYGRLDHWLPITLLEELL